MRPRERRMLQERRAGTLAAEARAIGIGKEVHQRVQVRMRVDAEYFREHVLAAAPGVEPVMDDGDPHGNPRRRLRWSAVTGEVARTPPILRDASGSAVPRHVPRVLPSARIHLGRPRSWCFVSD